MQFRYRMPWEEVKNTFPDLQYDPSQSTNYLDVSPQGHPLIAGLKFRFNSGLLEHVTAVLHWQIPKDAFKTISFEVMKEKYGADVKDDDAVIDRGLFPTLNSIPTYGKLLPLKLDPRIGNR